MRGKIVLAVLAAACLVAAGLYLSPAATDMVRQMLSAGQAAPDKPAADANAARSTSVVAATASTADFPIRRYAIGFVSSPAVVSVNARISSQITSIAVKDGQMVRAGDLLFSVDDRSLKAQQARDQATLAKDEALLASATADLERA